MKRLLLILVSILSVACSIGDDTNGDPVFCTEEARPGLVITVKGTTDSFSVEDVIVTATEDNYSETLTNTPDTNEFTGATERKGQYTLKVEKQGYQTYISENPIQVEADICHVITQNREIILIPN